MESPIHGHMSSLLLFNGDQINNVAPLRRACVVLFVFVSACLWFHKTSTFVMYDQLSFNKSELLSHFQTLIFFFSFVWVCFSHQNNIESHEKESAYRMSFCSSLNIGLRHLLIYLCITDLSTWIRFWRPLSAPTTPSQ